MTRLQSEWQRLYQAPADTGEHLRAMVLTLGRPADWAALGTVWQGVQAELGLPAPAIAVSGTDSYQLWFSLAKAVPAAEARAFLEALRLRYLAEIAPSRIGLLPHPDATVLTLPGEEVQDGQWSAFVASDLAPVFAETPWLDIPPKPDGQAELLARLQSITPAEWQAALALLEPRAPAIIQQHAGYPSGQDPWAFLANVMNDETAPLASRIEAAKALLPYSPKPT